MSNPLPGLRFAVLIDGDNIAIGAEVADALMAYRLPRHRYRLMPPKKS